MPIAPIELAKPFPSTRITQRFNGNFKLENGQNAYKDKHNAIDFVPTGTKVLGEPVRSLADGVVHEVRENHTVIVRHRFQGENYYIKYLHLLEPTVKVGQKVAMFETIGKVGGDPNDNIPDGGITTAPHLHIAMYKGSVATANVIDFEKYLKDDSYFTVKELSDWQEKAKQWSIVNGIISQKTWDEATPYEQTQLIFHAETLRKTHEFTLKEALKHLT